MKSLFAKYKVYLITLAVLLIYVLCAFALKMPCPIKHLTGISCAGCGMSRALMSSPKLLLLDEPSMGLSPLYVNTIFDMIKRVNSLGTTVLLVEQNAKKALSIANRAYVLEIGKIVKTGTGEELLGDEDIRKAYLGG